MEHEASSRAPAVLLALEDSGKQCWLRACPKLSSFSCFASEAHRSPDLEMCDLMKLQCFAQGRRVAVTLLGHIG